MVNTVRKNFEGFTKHEIKKAQEARRLQGMIGIPTDREFVGMVREKLIANCPINVKDIQNATIRSKTLQNATIPIYCWRRRCLWRRHYRHDATTHTPEFEKREESPVTNCGANLRTPIRFWGYTSIDGGPYNVAPIEIDVLFS